MEETKPIRMELPMSIDGMVEAYQAAEKNRFGKKSNKQDLLIKLMEIGESDFQNEIEVMVAEFNEYTKK